MNSKTASVFCLLMMMVLLRPAAAQTTCGGTGNGGACVWPWTYNGSTFTACMSQNHDQLWCATTYVNGTTNYNLWGNCNCKNTSKAGSTSTSKGGSTKGMSTSKGRSTSKAPTTTGAPATAAPTTAAPMTAAPTTAAPVTAAPTTAAPVTAAPVTAAPVTAAPVTAAPTTAAPATAAPTVHHTVYHAACTTQVSNAPAFIASTSKNSIMQSSIANASSLALDQVNIRAITLARRLSESARRLTAGGIHTAFTITFTAVHSNHAFTAATLDTSKLSSAIQHEAAKTGLTITVTGVTVHAVVTMQEGGTSLAPTTTAAADITSGAHHTVSTVRVLLALVGAVVIAAVGA